MPTYEKTDEALARLTDEQFRVTQQSGTERPGSGALLHNKAAGIDVASGEPLFASSAKYEGARSGRFVPRPIRGMSGRLPNAMI